MISIGGYISIDRTEAFKKNQDLIQRIRKGFRMSKLSELCDQIDADFAEDHFSLTLIAKLAMCAKMMEKSLREFTQVIDMDVEGLVDECCSILGEVEKILKE